ncbi:uncharacterized protein BYT42DRAFT_612588 [Radiomyces spectabilis]|uniref:uncharacterized protein n=1 Tax=Radiomyces spectabilis TaxID=64574 RepID=UPI00221EED3C|nr:uncharacterized protein BYT42DRAFT_612588 [Radiomyces spectabilis]KAI8384923.1 hypothetical protein BYT42DRAFT_612588 [Radiomyces spectabilis]
MAQTLPRKLLVAGGTGFLGLSICKAAALKGWDIVSLSRKGKPTSISSQNAPWADKVTWETGDALEPESYKHLLPGVTSVVHSVGILLEQDYKHVAQSQSLCGVLSGAAGVVAEMTGMKDRGNPLDPNQENHQMTYERMNRDTAIELAKAAGKESSTMESFVYISASDLFPMINPRYITTKREAEKFLFSRPEYRSIILRPGLMYSADRPAAIPLANAIKAANCVTAPLARDIASFPLGKLLTTPPLHIDVVAAAVVASIESKQKGIFDVAGIQEMARQY